MLSDDLVEAPSYQEWRVESDSLFHPVTKDVEEGYRWFLFSGNYVEGAYVLTKSGRLDLKVLLPYLGKEADQFDALPYFDMHAPRARFKVDHPILSAAQCHEDIFAEMKKSVQRFPSLKHRWSVLAERPFSLRITVGERVVGAEMVPIYRWFEFGGNMQETDGYVFAYTNDETFHYETSPAEVFLGGERKIYRCGFQARRRIHGLVELLNERMDAFLAGAAAWVCPCCGVEYSFQK